MQVFFSERDYQRYSRILGGMARRYELDIWAYCLMPNHVHLIVVPATESGLARPFGEAHRRYALEINRRRGWTGHLWQERFSSVPMEETHLLAAVRYVLLNPVRAGLVARPDAWHHSSARAHLAGAPDGLVNTKALAKRIEDWASYLAGPVLDDDFQAIRRNTGTGRPLGSENFVKDLEQRLGRRLLRLPPGPARRQRR